MERHAMTAQPMAPADVAWFHIDGPVNLAQVTGIVLTRKPLEPEVAGL